MNNKQFCHMVHDKTPDNGGMSGIISAEWKLPNTKNPHLSVRAFYKSYDFVLLLCFLLTKCNYACERCKSNDRKCGNGCSITCRSTGTHNDLRRVDAVPAVKYETITCSALSNHSLKLTNGECDLGLLAISSEVTRIRALCSRYGVVPPLITFGRGLVVAPAETGVCAEVVNNCKCNNDRFAIFVSVENGLAKLYKVCVARINRKSCSVERTCKCHARHAHNHSQHQNDCGKFLHLTNLQRIISISYRWTYYSTVVLCFQ